MIHAPPTILIGRFPCGIHLSIKPLIARISDVPTTDWSVVTRCTQLTRQLRMSYMPSTMGVLYQTFHPLCKSLNIEKNATVCRQIEHKSHALTLQSKWVRFPIGGSKHSLLNYILVYLVQRYVIHTRN